MSDNQSAKKADDKRRKYVKKPDLIPGFKHITDALAGLIFYVLGDDLTNRGWIRTGCLFHYLVFCAGLYLLVNARFKKTLNRRRALWQFGILCAIVLVIYYWLSFGPNNPARIPPLADLKLYLQIGDDRNTQVLVTNTLVFNSDIYIPANSYLAVPIQSNQPNVEFEFVVMNRSDIFTEDVELWVGIPSNREWSPEVGWVSAYRDDELFKTVSGNEKIKLKYVVFKTPTIYEFSGETSPGLRIATKFDDPEWLPVWIMIVSKKSPRTLALFQISFMPIPTNASAIPSFVQLQTNSDGKQWYELTAKKLQQLEK
ncbi:MAG: hypothetical protein ABSH38_00280 [Verrucomicrobiota bacterium]